MWHDRFLGSTAYFMSPRDEGGEGNGGVATDPPAEGGAPANDGTENGALTDEGAANEEGADADGEEGDGDDGEEGDDDFADVEGLTSEQKAKIKAKADAKLARETKWRDRQLERLYRQKREIEEDKKALEAIAKRQPKTGAGSQQGDPPDASDERRLTPDDVKTEAQRMRAQDQYDENCNATYTAGKEAFGKKWDEAMARLPKLGGIPDITDMMTILATDNPAMVLYTLANNPDEYERVMNLPVHRRNTEFVKIGLKPLPKAAKESKRPGHVDTVIQPLAGGRRVAAQKVDLYDDKADDDAWYEARNATRRRKISNVA